MLGFGAISPLWIIPAMVTIGVHECVFLKCPQCQKPALYNPGGIAWGEKWIWGPMMPDKCTKCGLAM
jgi:hypothetical protein